MGDRCDVKEREGECRVIVWRGLTRDDVSERMSILGVRR